MGKKTRKFSLKVLGTLTPQQHITAAESSASFDLLPTAGKDPFLFKVKGPRNAGPHPSLGATWAKVAERAREIGLEADNPLVENTSGDIHAAATAEHIALEGQLVLCLVPHSGGTQGTIILTVEEPTDPLVNQCLDQFANWRILCLARDLGMTWETGHSDEQDDQSESVC